MKVLMVRPVEVPVELKMPATCSDQLRERLCAEITTHNGCEGIACVDCYLYNQATYKAFCEAVNNG